MDLAFVTGFFTSAALIVAIGAQNAFVLRQGLKREHVLPVVAVCALSDVLLISLGVAGLGTLVQGSPLLLALARWGGAAFLLVYGAMAARRAWAGEHLSLQVAQPMSLAAAVAACLAFTYLNPHCWLDTVVLLGSISAGQPAGSRGLFAAGAFTASIVWFFALGYGARLLAPLFEKAVAWRVLDAAIALVMGSIAASLLAG
ncbi:MAG TPA: LysE/ArgO family amino acid transporter [Ideonella sp.]|nr:LysE/ArgO family amino acid transporter [Ideonella sp.]